MAQAHVRWVGSLAAALCLALTPGVAAVSAAPPVRGPVYVESQGLCYDTFATTDLVDNGPFQLLEPDPLNHCGTNTSKTLYGPGDPGYLGGRWITPEGTMFSCPLMGPGYPPQQ